MGKVDNYIVLDSETGGLNTLLCPITEIGFVILDSDSLVEVSRYDEYVKVIDPVVVSEDALKQLEKDSSYPKTTYVGGYLSEVAIEKTGIRPEILSSKGIDIKVVVDGCINLFESAKTGSGRYSKPVIVGHNIGFDIGFMSYMFKSCRKDLSKYIAGNVDSSGNWYPNYIDTITWVKSKDTSLNSYNLRSVAETMGIELSNAHRAITDVLATAQVFRLMVNNMRNDTRIQQTQRYRNRFQI